MGCIGSCCECLLGGLGFLSGEAYVGWCSVGLLGIWWFGGSGATGWFDVWWVSWYW